MRIGYMTDGGRRRPINEDAVKVMEDVNFYMLADGVGGNRSGEIASQSALDALEKFIRHNPPEWLEGRDEIFRYLRAAVRYVNQFIIKLSESKPQYTGMATTLVFAYIRDDEMFVANVGDSRLYQWNGSTLKRVTKDHSLVEEMLDRGEITPKEAQTHPHKNLITRALGTDRKVQADIYETQLSAGDRLLLCSDGLSNLISDEELAQYAGAALPLEEICVQLVDLANTRGGYDNITVLLISKED